MEFESSIIGTLSTDSISSIRSALFTEASEASLIVTGDVLVKRRITN